MLVRLVQFQSVGVRGSIPRSAELHRIGEYSDASAGSSPASLAPNMWHFQFEYGGIRSDGKQAVSPKTGCGNPETEP